MFLYTHIGIYYFIANGKEWVSIHTPYNPEYVKEIRKIPTAHWDFEDKTWSSSAEYGKEIEALVKKYFPDIPIDMQDNRDMGDLYK